ncbi:MAG: hypothetical protein LUI87_10065 [Lachnospiraceae bacterium]|nr:hypothetical protein [Lachnospiraceae bacterium]
MNDSLINPEFETDAYYNDKPISSDELLNKIKQESPSFQNAFRKNGFITSREYYFITCANFDGKKNCALDENKHPIIIKSDEEKTIAHNNLKCVEEYLRKRTGRDIKLKFMYRSSNECALYDAGRHFDKDIKYVLEDWFS